MVNKIIGEKSNDVTAVFVFDANKFKQQETGDERILYRFKLVPCVSYPVSILLQNLYTFATLATFACNARKDV